MDNLFSLLEDKGRLVNGIDDLPYDHSRYYKVPFTPEQMVGIMVYAKTSYAIPEDYYTDRKEIFYLKHQNLDAIETQSQMKDAAMQDITLKIIDLTPIIPESYELCDGHLMLKDFSSAFKGRDEKDHYFDWLKDISAEIPYELLQEFEEKAIKRRVSRWSNELKELLTVLKHDSFPFADSLQERLFS